jgi:pantothenate synthetase
MILFKQASALEAHLDKLRLQGESIGFVPTMGALHGEWNRGLQHFREPHSV